MQIQNDVSLSNYSTMRLGGKAHALATIINKDDLVKAVSWAQDKSLPILVLGSGSNVIFADGYDGLVIVNRINGFELTESDNDIKVTLGAGENWDKAVERVVEHGFSGIEMLSLIPGTAGAMPVQNVGAYGAEIADSLVELEVYNIQIHKFETLNKQDCGFAYRSSIFKDTHDRKYIIVSITLKLSRKLPEPPFYSSLQKYLDQNNIQNYTAQTIRDAVIAIRQDKLPDPAKIANTGSFFKNPIISADEFEPLAQKFPDIPNWPTKDGQFKIAAGWLLDKAGVKNYRSHGMKVYEKNALVFVNENAKGYADLEAFKTEVVEKVKKTFDITLQQEPELF